MSKRLVEIWLITAILEKLFVMGVMGITVGVFLWFLDRLSNMSW